MAVGELSFAFNPAAGETPETVKRKRMLAEAILGQASRAPKDVGEGLNAIGQALLYRKMMSDAGKGETAGASAASKIFQSLMGSNFPAPPPAATTAPTPDARAEMSGGADSPSPAQQASYAPNGNEIRDGILSTARALGIDPIDLGTAISYETAGTFDPMQKGPRTQWGQHKGLIQFGEPQAKQYGVDWSNPVGSQLGPDGAVAKYLRDTGVKPGMGMLDIYSAINAGGVGLYNRSDADNGGAPGTVRDKVEKQMAGHRAKALALLGDLSAPSPAPQGAVAAINAFAPAGKQVASLDPSAGLPVGDPYANIPARDGMGQDQIAKFRQWNSDPIANDQSNMASVDPAMQGVIKRAKEIAGTDFVIGSGARTPEMQKKAIEFGWSGTMDSDHLTGGAADLWPVDANGAVVFDKGRQQQIVAAMKQAASELGVDMEAGADWKKRDIPHFGMIGQTPINGPIPQQRPGSAGTQVASLDPRIGIGPSDAQNLDPRMAAGPNQATNLDPGIGMVAPRQPGEGEGVQTGDAGAATQGGIELLKRMMSQVPMGGGQFPRIAPPPQMAQAAPVAPQAVSPSERVAQAMMPATANDSGPGPWGASLSQADAATRAGPSMEQLMQAASDPWVAQKYGGIIEALLQQKLKASDPLTQLQIEKAKRELAAPPERKTTVVNGRLVDAQTGQEIASFPDAQDPFTLSPGEIRFGPDGKQIAAGGDKPIERKTIVVNGRLVDAQTGQEIANFPDQPKPTPDIQNYEYYAQKEQAAGRQPLGPLEWELAQKKAGATNVTTQVGAEPPDGALRKKLDEKTGELWSTYQQTGATSAALGQDMAVLDELIKIAPQGPVTGRLAEMFPGISSAGDAFQSIVKRVAPTLRAPGSGSTSDIEYDGMLKSLPALSNRPEANAMISAVMKSKAAINVERSGIIDAYGRGEISAGDARSKIAEIDKKSIMTPEMSKALGVLTEGSATTVGDQTAPATPKTDEEYNALPSGAIFVDPDDGKTYRKP